jgi:predicted metal-binding protein
LRNPLTVLRDDIVMSWRRHLCEALALFNFHSPDCEHCAVQDCMRGAMRRLQELNEHAQRIRQQKLTGEIEKTENDAA